MKKFSFNSINRKQPPKGVFIETIWKSRHRHLSISIVNGIGIDISIAKNSFLLSEFFLKNIIFMFFLVLTSHQYHFVTNTYFSTSSIYPSKGVHWCSRKRQFELSEPSVHWCFEKITAPKISTYFAYIPVKHAGWSSFKVHSQAFLGFFQKAL